MHSDEDTCLINDTGICWTKLWLHHFDCAYIIQLYNIENLNKAAILQKCCSFNLDLLGRFKSWSQIPKLKVIKFSNFGLIEISTIIVFGKKNKKTKHFS